MFKKNIAIVGGSLNGLMAGWELQKRGFNVTIFEASPRLQDYGAGLMLDPTFAESLLGLRHHPYQQRLVLGRHQEILWKKNVRKAAVSWGELYRVLRSRIPSECLLEGKKVIAAENSDQGATLTLSDKKELFFDLVIGSDGAGSTVRRRVDPDFKVSYCGYVAVRGTLPLHDVPSDSQGLMTHFQEGTFINIWGDNTHMVLYLLPGDPPLLNWIWYRNTEVDELPTLLTDKTGVVHQWSLPRGMMPDATRQLLLTEALQEFPSIATAAMQATSDLFLQVITQGVCDRFVNEQLVLMGDAAHIAVPHIGASVALGSEDAETLAEALASGVDWKSALAQWARLRHEKATGDLAISYRLGQALQKSNTDGLSQKNLDHWWNELTAGRNLYFEEREK